MGSIGVLLVANVLPYLEQELDKRYKLFRAWDYPNVAQLPSQHVTAIRAVVGNASAGADAALIEALPKLEIVSSFSVGVDKVDVEKCREKGIRVTYTPEVLTDEVADLAIGLMLAVLRRICESDRFVRSGQWKRGDYKLTTKVFGCPGERKRKKNEQLRVRGRPKSPSGLQRVCHLSNHLSSKQPVQSSRSGSLQLV